MSRFIEQLQEERARLAPLAKNRKKHESELEKLQVACVECLNQGLNAHDRHFAETKSKRNQAETLSQEALAAEKRIAEIDRVINARAEFDDEKLAVQVAYDNLRAAKKLKAKTEELASNLARECNQLERDIQSALEEHGKKQVEAMLADGNVLPAPSRIRELKDSLAASKASSTAAKKTMEEAAIQAQVAETKANEAYGAYMDKRLAVAELNYMLALEESMPEFAEYVALKGIAKNSVAPSQVLSIDLGLETVRVASEMIRAELREITGRDGS